MSSRRTAQSIVQTNCKNNFFAVIKKRDSAMTRENTLGTNYWWYSQPSATLVTLQVLSLCNRCHIFDSPRERCTNNIFHAVFSFGYFNIPYLHLDTRNTGFSIVEFILVISEFNRDLLLLNWGLLTLTFRNLCFFLRCTWNGLCGIMNKLKWLLPGYGQQWTNDF